MREGKRMNNEPKEAINVRQLAVELSRGVRGRYLFLFEARVVCGWDESQEVLATLYTS